MIVDTASSTDQFSGDWACDAPKLFLTRFRRNQLRHAQTKQGFSKGSLAYACPVGLTNAKIPFYSFLHSLTEHLLQQIFLPYDSRFKMSQQATSSTPVDADTIAPPSYTAQPPGEAPTDEKIAIEFVSLLSLQSRDFADIFLAGSRTLTTITSPKSSPNRHTNSLLRKQARKRVPRLPYRLFRLCRQAS